MRFKSILVCLLLAAASQALAQSPGEIGGVITDEAGEPVVGAYVQLKGSNEGVVTDVDGHFTFPKAKKGQTLVVKYIGMETQTVKAGSQMRVRLITSDQKLDEVLVVAFGQQKKSSFTGSAGVVKSDVLEKKQLTNVFSGLQGEIAGVQMTNTSGDPTSTPSFAIRGFGSINAGTSPLIIVDGAPYDGGWNNLNPNDVESVTVLKDAASNALYGARGANGVIMITTKQGKADRSVITFDAKWSANSRATVEYDRITDPAQYYETYYKALYNYNVRDKGMSAFDAHVAANNTLGGTGDLGGLGYIVYSVPDGEYLIGSNGRLNPNATLGNRVMNNGQVYTLYPDDWVKEAFRTGLRQEYNFSVNGGGSKSTFYASLGYLNNQGIVYNSDFERYTARIKADYQARKWLKVGGNVNYTHTDQNDVSSGSQTVFDTTTNFAPIYPVYLRDGEGNNTLDITFEATTDKETVINMTNHSYFNLNGDMSKEGTDMVLYINADKFTPADKTYMTTGEIKPVDGTPMDFRKAHAINETINDTTYDQIKNAEGYDHNWCLNTYKNGKGDDTEICASLYSPKTGILLEMYTNEPGVQVYTGNFQGTGIACKHGVKYPKHVSVCLESQKYPDSPNKKDWPSPYLKPGEKYYSHAAYKFSVK